MDVLGNIQWKATKMMKELEHISCKEQLGELGLPSLEKRRLRGILSTCINLKGGWKEDGSRLFSVVSMNRTRGNGQD